MVSLEKFKLSLVSWDSDKDPGGYPKWVKQWSSVVRSTKWGSQLESFLDRKLKRKFSTKSIIPSFLTEDEDLQDAPEAQPPQGGQGEGSDDALSHASIHSSAVSSKYADLDIRARELDATLYNTLVANIKGSKQSLLDGVMFSSYVQAMIILDHHMCLSINTRKTTAMDSLEKLNYHGDVHAYEVDAMKKIREVFEAKVSIEDVILMRVMRSFEGKSKTIQHKIADDINSPEGITENTNVFDMVHGYCRALATVGDGKSHPVKTVNDDVVCHNCNEKGHYANKCPKKEKIKCTHCGHKGHVEKDCRKKKREKEAKKKKEEAKKKEERAPTKVSSSVLAALMAKLEADTNMVLVDPTYKIRDPTYKIPHIRSSYMCTPSLYVEPNATEECKVGVKPPSTMVLGQAEPNPFKLSIETSLRSHCMMVQKTPPTPARDTQPKSKVKPEGSPESKGLNVLSLCDGMGCGALVLKTKKIPVNRYVGVEIDSEARNVCDATNPSERGRTSCICAH